MQLLLGSADNNGVRECAQLVRRWQLGTLNPTGASALYCHHYPVRALAAGPLETLVSADASGEVAVWKI